MGILGKLFGKRSGSQSMVTMSQEDLKKAIVSAYLEIKDIEKTESKKTSANDSLTGLIKTLLVASFVIVCLFCFLLFAAFVASFFPNIPIPTLPFDSPNYVKLLVIIISLVYGILSVFVCRAIAKETDRHFIIGYASLITSIAALVVSFVSLSK